MGVGRHCMFPVLMHYYLNSETMYKSSILVTVVRTQIMIPHYACNMLNVGTSSDKA